MASSMVSAFIGLAHRAGGQRDEVVTVLDLDQVVEPDVPARGLPVDEPREVVGERRARPLPDLPARDQRGLEPDVLLPAVHLDHDVDDAVLRLHCRSCLVCFHLVPPEPGSLLSGLGPPTSPVPDFRPRRTRLAKLSGRLRSSAYIRWGNGKIREVEEEPGLEKRPRRVPQERAATPDEVRAALDALGEADLVRLEKYARYRIRGLGRKAGGRDHDDLLGEAIQDTLDTEKRKWNKDVSLVRHLIGAMRSISSHWREQFDANEPLLESELLRTTDEGEVLSPLDLVGSGAPGAERMLAAKEEVERIEKTVADDTVVSDILGGLRAEMSPSEIREALGLSVTEYETAMKRFRRQVRPTAG